MVFITASMTGGASAAGAAGGQGASAFYMARQHTAGGKRAAFGELHARLLEVFLFAQRQRAAGRKQCRQEQRGSEEERLTQGAAGWWRGIHG